MLINNEPFHAEYDDAISRGEIQPVILLGAPRSGTQLYRDMICSHTDVCTWPYNEMTYMWRYGNRDYQTDELPVSLLTEEIAQYIRNCFIKLGKKSDSRYVLDKTCHNCLRPDFVAAVLPEAKYIYLVRHGMDVIPSVVKRASTPPPKGEFKRVFSIPMGDVLYYVKKALWNHGGLLGTRDRVVRKWGPRFKGMDELVKTQPLEVVSAYQWLRHMEITDGFLEQSDFDAELLRVKYESITTDVAGSLEQVFGFLDLDTPSELTEKWSSKVHRNEPGSKGALLGEHEADVYQIVSDKNSAHGYS